MIVVMRTIIRTLAFAGLLGVTALNAHAQRGSPCGTSEKRNWLRFKLEPMMLSADSAAAEGRRSLRLPLVHPDSIVYIDDERICARAAKVYYRDRGGPMPLLGVSVARVGDRFLVYGENRAGEWTIMDVFNRDFEFIGAIGF